MAQTFGPEKITESQELQAKAPSSLICDRLVGTNSFKEETKDIANNHRRT
jgi:hypothetical protein